MSLVNFQKNVITSVREQNFKICHNRNWSAEEFDSHIDLYDEKNNLIGQFLGHISLSKYLNS